MKSKYEISIWSDIYDEALGRFVEKKEVIIGSDTMTSENRARDPKLINNINGTNKFTFDLYYKYINTRTGEEVENPYVAYLVNERKIKVFWKDEWYDLLVKSIKEDQAGRVFSYTCEDCYVTELSRSGFELEFATELQNNIGTAKELVEKVIDNTDWQYDEANSDTIYQLTEEPVYEVEILYDCTLNKCPSGEGILHGGHMALLYYSFATDPSINNLKSQIQLCYSDDDYLCDENDMLVINGDCYNLTVDWVIDSNNDHRAKAYYNSTHLFTVDFNTGVSQRFRAKRYVQSQKTEYCDILERYVNVYNSATEIEDGHPKVIYGYPTTEYNDALAVVNLITNPSNFKNVQGWRRQASDPTKLYFKLSPGFDSSTVISDYTATSFLYLPVGITFNTGILNNKTYISNGFSLGERYIFRVKLKSSGNEPGSTSDYVNVTSGDAMSTFQPSIQSRDINYVPTGTQYFQIVENGRSYTEDYWNEYVMECCKSCSYDMLSSSESPFGIFLTTTAQYWIEDIQFYREVYGVNGDGIPTRIDPNQLAIQSVAQQYWKYFWKDQDSGTTKDTLEYIYTSLSEWSDAIPQLNGYQRYGTIEADNSNRFNILQTIAETFECWVRFVIKHEDNGAISYTNGKLDKYIQLKRETGEETGIGFVYGIDLKGVTRNIKSDKIATKTIVEQNNNEFGKNGFCSIARSEQNYSRENFIYNFDYYVQQGLLDKNTLYNDLYGVNGYYANLNARNVEYATNLDVITNKKIEQTKQKAMATVYGQYISASEEELNSIVDSLIKLAGTEDEEDPFTAALNYAQNNHKNTKVQSLVNDYYSTKNTKESYETLYTSINDSLTALNTYINNFNARQTTLIDELRELNRRFYAKYSRFIQEGSWTSEDYWDDDQYYLDALQVAYQSARPQVSYDISVLRLSDVENYSSKVFHLGDISFIQDVEYFGYKEDKITPYKEKVILTEITSCFDTPDKDVIKVQNYKTQFDDLFQRITASVQNLEFTQGKYAKAANIMASDGTIRSSVIQNTFNENKDLVYGAQNESATIDNTGITVTDTANGAKQVKITSGGIFVTDDGGASWKNAIRGDGISADVVTTGKLNTEAVTIYGAEAPSFTWDQYGINAYVIDEGGHVESYIAATDVTASNFDEKIYYVYNSSKQKYEIADVYTSSASYYTLNDFQSIYVEATDVTESNFNKDIYYTKDDGNYTIASAYEPNVTYYTPTRATNYNQFVRFDKYGVYGIKGKDNYQPISETQIYQDANFGLTWNKFFMKNANGDKYIEISTDRDIVINDAGLERIKIGRLDSIHTNSYGIRITRPVEDDQGRIIAKTLFECGNIFDSNTGQYVETANIAGWKFYSDRLESELNGNQYIKIAADGNIGCYGGEATSYQEYVYSVYPTNSFTAIGLNTTDYTFNTSQTVGVFVSSIGKTITTRIAEGDVEPNWKTNTSTIVYPTPPDNSIQLGRVVNNKTYNYKVNDITFVYNLNTSHSTAVTTTTGTGDDSYTYTVYTYLFDTVIKSGSTTLFNLQYTSTFNTSMSKYIPAAETKWTIDNNGDAIFHNIRADGGTIAGWIIDNEKIYQVDKNGNITTQLNSTGMAKVSGDNIDYTIITDAINAAIATVGGVLLQQGTIQGYKMQDVANAAYAALNGLSNKADKEDLDDYVKNETYNNHTHEITITTDQVGVTGKDSMGGALQSAKTGTVVTSVNKYTSKP